MITVLNLPVLFQEFCLSLVWPMDWVISWHESYRSQKLYVLASIHHSVYVYGLCNFLNWKGLCSFYYVYPFSKTKPPFQTDQTKVSHDITHELTMQLISFWVFGPILHFLWHKISLHSYPLYVRSRTKVEVKKRGGGFTKLCSLSPELQKFTGVPELARTEV